MTEYTHQKLGEEHGFLSGYYVPTKEVRLKHDDREVLYVVGQAVQESGCCSVGSIPYVIVPGYIVNWHKASNPEGLPLTEVEPISDRAARDSVRQAIQADEAILLIDFW